ncbi:hypothetical protein ACF3VQ_21615 (plasmid) [Yersinia sp. HM-2024]|uniref:hypothetical protein n=1 Tax=Yersinia sp. HM-2024 TaxID=3344550 RepID=UPI00370D1FB8
MVSIKQLAANLTPGTIKVKLYLITGIIPHGSNRTRCCDFIRPCSGVFIISIGILCPGEYDSGCDKCLIIFSFCQQFCFSILPKNGIPLSASLTIGKCKTKIFEFLVANLIGTWTDPVFFTITQFQ